mmetsp:Transcript_27996/g.39565  ORF Transcript_27996/g.39565 Transcript_27996/m.39565 type:complete len:567 (-) Transcript_27996:202-1902(-)|eukprot:CAMPEP_0202462176 /NCGR_PEP_ID=MMETSP1360-20130828/52845_1 /ASSEMBLY_ACC=CAM_ASM_000848 /TAXON_ID=515479 /ORGANISM="Licmophora paradoxa, Strain CCMP2313" /LENGTH=566 /DNA_ID=CAMNT_0049084525 /DNA_START=87 /DNA_END=1787 /DNA_ORIENTATION=-
MSSLTSLPSPTNHLVSALLTDLYQLTMVYAHWKNNRHNNQATFELFFRKNPFGGEYTIFCGLDEVLKFVQNYKFTEEDIEYLRSTESLQDCDPQFWEYLRQLDCSEVKLLAMKQGTIAFPRIPLIVVQAPLGIGQLLETTLLTLVNYPSLIATNAARMVIAAGDSQTNPSRHPYPQCKKKPECVEFGLRRAQGPDGGFSASKYSAVGGFIGTSNVQAGRLLGLPIAGTHAHAFVQAYASLDEVEDCQVIDTHTGNMVKLLPKVEEYRNEFGGPYLTTNKGELAAFIAYAAAFPGSFLCLIDTYDTLKSGLLNFCLVCHVLDDLGYKPRGIRLDSGDLAYLSIEVAKHFYSLREKRPLFDNLNIVASNDINEEVLISLGKEGHAITIFGIGTNLVTCQKQPALGCVYKLVELDGQPRIKLSQEIEKVLIPGRKTPYRLYGAKGWPLLDLMVTEKEPIPTAGTRIMCRHPFDELKRANVTATRVEPLHNVVFDRGVLSPTNSSGDTACDSDVLNLTQAKEFVESQLKSIRGDILRFTNPTPYKVSISQDLFEFLHELWEKETPVAELK